MCIVLQFPLFLHTCPSCFFLLPSDGCIFKSCILSSQIMQEMLDSGCIGRKRVSCDGHCEKRGYTILGTSRMDSRPGITASSRKRAPLRIHALHTPSALQLHHPTYPHFQSNSIRITLSLRKHVFPIQRVTKGCRSEAVLQGLFL